MLGEPALAGLKKGAIIQLQRKVRLGDLWLHETGSISQGFFIVDHVYAAKSEYTDCELPLSLIAIPDGSAQPKVR